MTTASRRVSSPSVRRRPGADAGGQAGGFGELIATAGVPAGSGRDGVLDLEADFTLRTLDKIFTQVVTDGSAPVRWDYVLVRFAGAPEPQLSIEIEDLWHMGVPLADPEFSGGGAVELIPGYNPRDFAFSGPDRVLPAGAWVARLRFEALVAAGSAGGERFEVTLSNVAAAGGGVAPGFRRSPRASGDRSAVQPLPADAGAFSGLFPRAAAPGARPDLDCPGVTSRCICHAADRPFPCGLRGPVAADLHRARFAPPLETSPPRHPSAQYILTSDSRQNDCHGEQRGGWGVPEGRCAEPP